MAVEGASAKSADVPSFGQSPLTEQLLLIAINRTSGRLRERPPGSLAYAAAGAMLTDLLAAGIATVVDGKVVAAMDASLSPLGEVFVREVAALPAPQSLAFWVNALTFKPFTAQAYALESLRRRGAVAVTTRRLLMIWPVTRYRVVAVGERERALAKIAAAVASEAMLDEPTASLITLTASCGLMKHIVPRSLRRSARMRVKQLAQTSTLTGAMAGQNHPAHMIGDVFDAVWFGGPAGGGGHGGAHGGGHGGH